MKVSTPRFKWIFCYALCFESSVHISQHPVKRLTTVNMTDGHFKGEGHHKTPF